MSDKAIPAVSTTRLAAEAAGVQVDTTVYLILAAAQRLREAAQALLPLLPPEPEDPEADNPMHSPRVLMAASLKEWELLEEGKDPVFVSRVSGGIYENPESAGDYNVIERPAHMPARRAKP